MSKEKQIESIYLNYVNGNLRDMTKLITEYGEYNFFDDLKFYLEDQYFSLENCYIIFCKIVISFMRIKNR